MHSRTKTWARAASLLMLGVLLIAATVQRASGQTPEDMYPGDGVAKPTRALPMVQSRAEQAAEDLVSLSPDKIVDILQRESGLLLEVKKLLVRKAYEQGRVLDPQDLTDEALFRLVREDENIRVLVTQEIEDRAYISAKPTREERARGDIVSVKDQTDKTASPTTPKPAESQEESYWKTHQLKTDLGPEPVLPPAQGIPDTIPAQPSNQIAPDIRRQTEVTELQRTDADYPELLGTAGGPMPPVKPEDLPALLNTSASDRPFTTGNLAGSRNGTPTQSGNTAAIPSFYQSSPSYLGTGGNPWATQPMQASVRQPLGYWSQSDLRPAQPMLKHQANPYADIPSLYDLYSQYPNKSAMVRRFGAEIFHNGTGNFESLPMDLPAGPEYVLGPGDGLNIELWGGVSERLLRIVDREGKLALPEVGAVQVAGRSLGDVQHLVQTALRTQFRDVQADVSLSRLRSVRIYVVGDVERPGAYDVSALSTPLNALYVAGGPTTAGSLRIVRHYRGKQLVQEVDLYDLLLHGVHADLLGLQAGDTIQVPPLGPEVTIEGMVRRPAIYELHGESSLAEVLQLAGGVLRSGTLRHVDVERVESHQSRQMLRLDIPEDNNQQNVTQALDNFKVDDGDKIKISPILPYAEKTVYLEGHAFRPGKFAYRDGMTVKDLIGSYNDLLPEPYKRHAEIIRLQPPDYKPVILAFNLDNALAGQDQNLLLKPFDTVRIFGRFDFEDAPVVTVTGAVRDPGDHVTNGATRLRDAVYLAGGTTSDAQLDDAQVLRRTDDGQLKVLSVNLRKALAGDEADDVLLQPKDRLIIHHNQAKVDPATVSIQGEVARPGKYPLGETMTAADLVRVAGGFKRGAYVEMADLTRYEVENGSSVASEHIPVQIAKAMAGEPDSDQRLHDGDVLTIRQLTGWNDIGASISVKGEVVHPGTYGIQEGERLSSVLVRAGGLSSDAYPYGAVFERAQVRELEEKNRAELLHEVQEEGTELKIVPDGDADQKAAKQASLMQWQSTMQKLQDAPPEGRLVIHVSKDMKRWANTSADIQVRAGDSIYIPKRPSIVMVDGSVFNPTAITYKPGKSAAWYLHQAGGPTNMANKKAIFVIRADGSVVGGSGGLFSGGVEKASMQPGDMVMVPEKAFSSNTRWKDTLEGAQLAYAVGIAIQVARSF